MNKKVILMILDGWGIAGRKSVSAPYIAHTPFIDGLCKKYASATLRTDGLHVGLPEGQMGNSEVGHINLGAGRIVYQNLAKINKAVGEKTLEKESAFVDAFDYATKNNKNIHLLGLVSDGGIHAHINHLKGILDFASKKNTPPVFLHAFTDGRDCDPKSGADFIAEIQRYMQKTTGKLASVTGRYYAMDRDRRWERVKRAYDAILRGGGTPSENAVESIHTAYKNGTTDEFIKPIILQENGAPVATVQKGDVVLFFNFRTDRGRELTEVISQKAKPDFDMQPIETHFVTLTNYDETFKNIKVIYDNENLSETLGEVLEKAGKKQIRIAETEKYPHVTFFFSGGREAPFEWEKRILRASPKVATYDLKPEMSAYELKDALLPELEKSTADFVCLNFANGDMVGHTGVMEAAVKACEAVDNCAKAIIEKGLENGYTTLLIADHGNCELMQNEDGSPNTAHTTNPVPMILIDDTLTKIKDGVLGDVAPTILKMMGIEKPTKMTGKSLI